MEPIYRALIVYFVLMVLFRITGRRALSQITSFDLVLLLIISEAVQNGIVGKDYSLINTGLTVATLIFIDVLMSLLKQYLPAVDRFVDGTPYVIVDHGKPILTRMNHSRVDEGDVMEAAREKAGLERMEQIKYAVLERDGEISIIPVEKAR
jgi:uncharacterized membrane protein YcaP (DUF421 family)